MWCPLQSLPRRSTQPVMHVPLLPSMYRFVPWSTTKKKSKPYREGTYRAVQTHKSERHAVSGACPRPHHRRHAASRFVLNPGAVAITVGVIFVVRPILDHAETFLTGERHFVPRDMVSETVAASASRSGEVNSGQRVRGSFVRRGLHGHGEV